jgi:hypothetical protein
MHTDASRTSISYVIRPPRCRIDCQRDHVLGLAAITCIRERPNNRLATATLRLLTTTVVSMNRHVSQALMLINHVRHRAPDNGAQFRYHENGTCQANGGPQIIRSTIRLCTITTRPSARDSLLGAAGKRTLNRFAESSSTSKIALRLQAASSGVQLSHSLVRGLHIIQNQFKMTALAARIGRNRLCYAEYGKGTFCHDKNPPPPQPSLSRP